MGRVYAKGLRVVGLRAPGAEVTPVVDTVFLYPITAGFNQVHRTRKGPHLDL